MKFQTISTYKDGVLANIRHKFFNGVSTDLPEVVDLFINLTKTIKASIASIPRKTLRAKMTLSTPNKIATAYSSSAKLPFLTIF